MARVDTLEHFLTDVADAIRGKTKSAESIQPKDFDTEIDSIGGDVPVKGIVLSNFNSNGFPQQADIYGNNFPDFYFMCNSDNLTKAIWGTQLIQTYPTSYVKKIVLHTDEDYHYTARRCFAYNKSLEEIEYPENVDYIYLWGGNFLGCTALKSFPISKIHGFNSNNKTSIYEGIFNGCTNLESDVDVLPNHITSIWVQAFNDCTKINFTSLNNVTSIGQVNNTVIFQSSGGYTFHNCTSLSLTELPENLTLIYGPYNFAGCTSLQISGIPGGVTSLPNNTFQGCTSIWEMNLNNVTSVGQYCFDGCTSLRKLYLTNVTTLGAYAFNGCSDLRTLTIPEATSITNYSVFHNCSNVIDVIMPKIVTFGTSNTNAIFDGCTSLKRIWLGDSVTSISRYAFCGISSSVIAIYINLPRATVEAMTNYNYVFSNNQLNASVIICNDDSNFIDQSTFESIIYNDENPK